MAASSNENESTDGSRLGSLGESSVNTRVWDNALRRPAQPVRFLLEADAAFSRNLHEPRLIAEFGTPTSLLVSASARISAEDSLLIIPRTHSRH